MAKEKNPFVPCDRCKDKLHTQVVGWYYTDETKTQVLECECHKEWKIKNLYKIRAKKSKLMTFSSSEDSSPYDWRIHYKGDLSRDVPLKLEHIINNIDKPLFKNSSLYLYGKEQTQKTVLINWVGISLAMKGYIVLYEKTHEFLDRIVCTSFDKDQIEKASEYRKKVMEADFLILDDFMLSDRAPYYGKLSPYVDLYLRERLEVNNKPIYFVSSYKPKDLVCNAFSDSTKSFIDSIVRRTNTYLNCLDSINKIDNLDDLFLGIKNEEN